MVPVTVVVVELPPLSVALTVRLKGPAGTPAGTIVGQTDVDGARSVGHEYNPKHIAATIYTKLGIPLHTTHVIGNGRPMRLCEGTPIPELTG